MKVTSADQDAPPSAPPNADLLVIPMRGPTAQTIEEAKAYFFRRGYGVSRAASDDPEADLSVHFGPFPEAQDRYVYPSSTFVRA